MDLGHWRSSPHRQIHRFFSVFFHQFHQFRNHVETYHSGNKYICPYCGKDMPTDKKLQNHIMLNHEVDKTKKDFVCDLCGYATHLKVRQISVF